MTPLGHLAFGYLVYAGARRVRRGSAPGTWSTVAVAVGTQFPDVVDKPLSWWLGVLPTGRTLGHSVLTVVVVTAIVLRYARSVGRPELGRAFAVGYASHLLGDLYSAVLSDDQTLWFAFWPIVPQERYAGPDPAAVVQAGAAATAYFGAFVAVVGALYWRVGLRGGTYVVAVAALVAATVGAAIVLIGIDPGFLLELVVVDVAAAVWISDGLPGLPRRRERA